MVDVDLVLDAGLKSLVFSVSIEIDLVSLWVVEIDLFLCEWSKLN